MSRDAKTDLTPIARLYEESLGEHGTASMGVGWRDEASHLLRFERLARVIDVTHRPSINDLGCGYGAFLDYLSSAGVAITLFRGYDISAEMVERARRLHPRAEFYQGSLLDRVADYSFACGIFNVRLKESEQTWLTHIERTLDNLNSYSKHGFAFNLLSTYVDFRESHLYYGDPLYFFDRCKKVYSRTVALYHDYPLYEWTITVRK